MSSVSNLDAYFPQHLALSICGSLVKCGIVIGDLPRIPNRIRALARVIQNADPFQFPDLHDHDTGELVESAVVTLLHELGVQLSLDDRRVFPFALRECKRTLWRAAVYSRQAQANSSHSPDSAVRSIASVLAQCNAIDIEVAFAGAALGSIPDAVLHAYTLFTRIAALDRELSTHPVLIELYERVLAPLQRMHGIIRDHNMYVTRRQATFSEVELDDIAIANEAIAFTTAHLIQILGALENPGGFSVTAMFDDATVCALWCEHIGEHTPAVLMADAAPLLDCFPEWARAMVAQFVDYLGHGVLSAFALRRALVLWGPGPILPYRVAAELRRRAGFLVGTTPRAARRAVEEAAKPGSYAVTLESEGAEPRLSLSVRVERLDKSVRVRTLPIVRVDGLWQIVGISPAHGLGGYETVSAAIEAFPALCTHSIGTEHKAAGFATSEGDFSARTSLLHRAAYRCDASLIARLMNYGSEGLVNCPQSDEIISGGEDWVPLMYVAWSPMTPHVAPCMRLLTERGADVGFHDSFGRTALLFAILNGHADGVAHLLSCQPGLRESASTVSPLLVAIGAHWLHPDINDIHELATLRVSAAVVEALLFSGGAAQLSRADLELVLEILRVKEAGCDAAYAAQPHVDAGFVGRHAAQWRRHASLLQPDQRQRVITSIVAHGALMRRERGGVAELFRARRAVQRFLFFQSVQQFAAAPLRMPLLHDGSDVIDTESIPWSAFGGDVGGVAVASDASSASSPASAVAEYAAARDAVVV